jgi:hypothetical protein
MLKMLMMMVCVRRDTVEALFRLGVVRACSALSRSAIAVDSKTACEIPQSILKVAAGF